VDLVPGRPCAVEYAAVMLMNHSTCGGVALRDADESSAPARWVLESRNLPGFGSARAARVLEGGARVRGPHYATKKIFFSLFFLQIKQ